MGLKTRIVLPRLRSKKPLTANEAAFAFEQPTLDDHLEALRARGLRYRTKLTQSGPMLEIETYPINKIWRAGAIRQKSANETRPAQRSLNNLNTRKHISRLIHANFDDSDIWLTFGYSHENMPAGTSAATKHISDYIKRLRRYLRRRDLLPAGGLKYIYVTECVHNAKTGKIHTHHHIIMNFGDRDIAESIWKMGGRTHSRRLQPDTDGSLEGLARYIAKPETKDYNRKGTKTYRTSLNLTKPTVRISDYGIPGTGCRLSKRRVEQMVLSEMHLTDTLYKHFPGYRLADAPQVRYSEYCAGAYVYARMYRDGTQHGAKRARHNTRAAAHSTAQVTRKPIATPQRR